MQMLVFFKLLEKTFLWYTVAMAEKLKNIIEDIATDFMDNCLAMRYHICTYPSCKKDMLAYVLSHVPAKYVTTDKGALHIIIDQTRLEKEAEIARAVISAVEIVSKNPRHAMKEDRNQAFQLLLNKILEDRGLDFRHYHQELLKRRVAIRMRAHKVTSFSEYLMVLLRTPQEYDKLFAILCINVSEFFRDTDVWIELKNTIKEVVQQKASRNDRVLIIWSSACATGEEPYSLAIMLKDAFGSEIKNFALQIIASDIDPKALRASDKAEYQSRVMRNLSKEQVEKYFTQLNSDTWKIKDEIKNMVTFKSTDLISSEFTKNIDIILCRNVFIYFTRSLQDQILMKFYHSLREGGYLIIGKTETMWAEAKQIFEEVNALTRIYKTTSSGQNISSI